MKNKMLILSTGFALFSMFFGSGNLVFPLTVGLESEGHYLLAGFGIVLTGVIVPFLGVLGMLLYKGDISDFFRCFGKTGIFIFSLLALALMGPFGVLARCLTVAHGAVLPLFPSASLGWTSLGMCILVFLLTVNKNKIVPLLGTYLTPLLLVSIGAIVYFGITQGEFPLEKSAEGWNAFSNGFFQGYQTMDLLAAFFFSNFVIKHLYGHSGDDHTEKSLLKVFFKAAMVGAGILSTVYMALVVMGWLHSPVLTGVPPQEMLGVVAFQSLGSFAAPLVCLAVVFACMTTAIVLASLFADFLRTEVSKNKLTNTQALTITLTIGFLVSNLDFAGIASFIGPILEATYPALIALTLVNICNKFWEMELSHWPFTLTLAAKLCMV